MRLPPATPTYPPFQHYDAPDAVPARWRCETNKQAREEEKNDTSYIVPVSQRNVCVYSVINFMKLIQFRDVQSMWGTGDDKSAQPSDENNFSI